MLKQSTHFWGVYFIYIYIYVCVYIYIFFKHCAVLGHHLLYTAPAYHVTFVMIVQNLHLAVKKLMTLKISFEIGVHVLLFVIVGR